MRGLWESAAGREGTFEKTVDPQSREPQHPATQNQRTSVAFGT